MTNFKRTLSTLLLMATFGWFAGLTQSAFAKGPPPRPQIENFYVTPTGQFAPGTELTFTMEGTARGNASVRITGVSRNIPLREVDAGIYEGDYTISSRDRLNPDSILRASLRSGKLTATSNQRLGVGPRQAQAPAPVAAPVALGIQRFTVSPINKIEPGAELKFGLAGTPRGKASFTIDGVVSDVPMQEVSPGNYEGSYTIRRLDHFPGDVVINASLGANGQVVRSRLTQMLVTDGKPPTIRNLSPRNGENLTGNVALISATFDDAGGVGVDAKSVKILFAGRDVTRNATVTPQYFTYRAETEPGTYPVEVTARDLAGNAVRTTWTFSVGAQAPAAVVNLPLQVLSHVNNAQVGSGTIDVRGRTAPDATVDVQVQAIASVAGFFGVTQQVSTQRLRADAGGNFAFNFQPQVAAPGTRYEINLTASKGDATRETKLVLFQQK